MAQNSRCRNQPGDGAKVASRKIGVSKAGIRHEDQPPLDTGFCNTLADLPTRLEWNFAVANGWRFYKLGAAKFQSGDVAVCDSLEQRQPAVGIRCSQTHRNV